MDYRKEVLRTANITGGNLKHDLSLGAMGLSGESGEVTDLIKKHIFHEQPLDVDKLLKEMGDVYWYLEYLGAVVGVSTETIMARNIAKIRARFPDGFNPAASAAKADEWTSQ